MLSAATDLFLLRQLQHLCPLLEITCILWNSLDPYAHVISFLLTPSLSRNPAGFAGARYNIFYWICNDILCYFGLYFWLYCYCIRLFYVKQRAHMNVSNLLWVLTVDWMTGKYNPQILWHSSVADDDCAVDPLMPVLAYSMCSVHTHTNPHTDACTQTHKHTHTHTHKHACIYIILTLVDLSSSLLICSHLALSALHSLLAASAFLPASSSCPTRF